MDIWYTENHTDNVRLSIRIDRQLASVQSEFQRIDVFDSVEFGRIMTLDGLLMVTEKDDYSHSYGDQPEHQKGSGDRCRRRRHGTGTLPLPLH